MFNELLKILGAGLSIWDHKEKTKYVDRLISLKRDYDEELNKPDDQRSDAVLDHLERELRLVGIAFAAGVGGSNPTIK